jgi:probable rRNA maturation factor
MGDRVSGPRRRLQITVVGPRPPVRAASGLGPWLEGAAPASARGEVSVALVSDPHMRRLNAAFRHVDAVTDVLSFPAEGALFLGDIAIARGRARRQALAHGHALRTELRLLALHGLLHLLGYDHEADDGRMRRVETRLRRRAGLPSGLTERADR